MTLPPRSQRLVDATPIHPREHGVNACIEFTIYADGHAGIAVSRVEGKPPNRRIVQADSLPLNHVQELHDHIEAILDRVARHARQ
jgi:hypothetical protein